MNLETLAFERLVLFAVLGFVLWNQFKKRNKNSRKEERESSKEGNSKGSDFLRLWADIPTLAGTLLFAVLGIGALYYLNPADSVRWYGTEKAQALIYALVAFSVFPFSLLFG